LRLHNLGHAVALHFIHYNFCRVHQTLRVTPAMAAGIADHVWDIDELIALMPKAVAKPWGSVKRAAALYPRLKSTSARDRSPPSGGGPQPSRAAGDAAAGRGWKLGSRAALPMTAFSSKGFTLVRR